MDTITLKDVARAVGVSVMTVSNVVNGRLDRVSPATAGPAALAVSTGAPLCSASITYERLTGARRRAAGTAWGVVIEFGRLLSVPDDVPRSDRVAVLTQAWVDDLGRGISRAPQDWHMLQKVFVADLDPERYARTRAAAGEAAS